MQVLCGLEMGVAAGAEESQLRTPGSLEETTFSSNAHHLEL